MQALDLRSDDGDAFGMAPGDFRFPSLYILVRTAALMACADGLPKMIERHALLAFLYRQDVVEARCKDPILAVYDQAVAGLQAGLQPKANELGLLRLAADDHHAAVIIAMAAAHVAASDGVVQPQEIVMLRLIRNQLLLS
ncbi:hypothetical protein [Acidisoma sp. S159]|uniref:hypothetical protein n=1 Tax=Acidisoma sp. S159 TaxID=1747225 RepID=UPI00131CD800|nr:hypothetical protein [Acidisoma sp. S159]